MKVLVAKDLSGQSGLEAASLDDGAEALQSQADGRVRGKFVLERR